MGRCILPAKNSCRNALSDLCRLDCCRLNLVSIFKGLEVWVHIEVSIVISFGLEIFASVFVFGFVMEVFMKNSIAFFTSVFACVWCGIAFLRSSGEKKFQPEREISAV